MAAAKIPFTILTLIIFTMPLFVSLLSFPVLKERVGFLGSLSVVFGFIGIIIAVDPFNEPPNIFSRRTIRIFYMGWLFYRYGN